MDPSSHTLPSPATSTPALTELTDDERVEQAGLGSFPASDPPSWTSGRERRPHAYDPDDGGDNRDRERRRRHVDA